MYFFVHFILYSKTKVSRNIFLHDWKTQGCYYFSQLDHSEPKQKSQKSWGRDRRRIYILSKNILEVVLSTNRSQYSTNKAQRNRKILDIRDTFKQVKNCSSHCFIYCIIFPFRHFPRTFHQNEWVFLSIIYRVLLASHENRYLTPILIHIGFF